MSYLMESEAPRDFRISSTESDGHYTKCLLCYTVKKNFYCSECVQNGSFVHSAMPYSDRYSEKQAKLLRLRRNRQHILDRCNKLLSPKLQRDILITETKHAKEKLELLKLAVQQRRTKIDELKKDLMEVKAHNNELSQKLPRYQKRVSSVDRLAEGQREKLRNQIEVYNEHAESLAALRRSRIRQLIRYIFPVYMSYDTSDSIEDMEFIGEEEEGPPQRPQLHIVAPWVDVDCDASQFQACMAGNRESGAGGSGGGESALPVPAAGRARAALGLAAQLVALLAATLDVRLPHAINLSDYCEGRCAGGWSGCVGRVRAGCAALCGHAALPPAAPLAGLHELALAAAADLPALGRAPPPPPDERWAAAAAWAGGEDEPEPPEHLSWPEAEPAAPDQPPSLSLVTSLASMWRGWTK
ncbi:beclin 1-associated autophagy-related key regulator-like [Aricia agestis]|uniref:beclin 1-associated autophagy-related key regulator-like n=1 Tax=Aricia agestis TaxID=91739 RepID=UPI001C205367|nr:beclin 1-associated autophagy-related key regulator-like [Aricia agestis]